MKRASTTPGPYFLTGQHADILELIEHHRWLFSANAYGEEEYGATSTYNRKTMSACLSFSTWLVRMNTRRTHPRCLCNLSSQCCHVSVSVLTLLSNHKVGDRLGVVLIDHLYAKEDNSRSRVRNFFSTTKMLPEAPHAKSVQKDNSVEWHG